MRALELIRIITIVVLGAALIFFLQPWLYYSQNIVIGDVDLKVWLADQYMPGAYLVGGVAIAATFLWYFLSAGAKILSSKDTSQWRLLWWIILLAPVLSIGGALAFFNRSRDALLTLTLLYVLDVLVLFWLPTATSSPMATKFLPPGSFLMRRLLEPGS